MKKTQSNPVAALCVVTTLIILQFAARHCMKKYGRRS